jgi:hypothetical protein
MPDHDNQQAKTAATAAASKGKRGPIRLPAPTDDQREYLEKIRKAGEEYNGSTIVGGPRRHTG